MIPLFKVFVSPEASAKVGATLASGYIAQGPRVDEFEQLLANHFGGARICTVNSCTSAIHLALHLIKRDYGLTDDAEVISTPLTCAASNFPIVANRLRIKWADINPVNLNIALDDVERKLTANTRVLLFVHWGGYPIDYDRLDNIKANYESRFGQTLIVIEDCAHAWEANFRGRPVGVVQDNFACYSFQAIKSLTTGDGGLLITPDDQFHRQARLARWFGLDRDNKLDFRSSQDIEQWGFKFHMNDIAAGIGLTNYPHVAALVEKHKQNARIYREALADVAGVKLLEQRQGVDASYWLFTIRVANRSAFIRAMESQGIQVNAVHTRNDHYRALAEFKAELPVMDQVAQDMICIPVGWWLGEADRDHIITAIRKGW